MRLSSTSTCTNLKTAAAGTAVCVHDMWDTACPWLDAHGPWPVFACGPAAAADGLSGTTTALYIVNVCLIRWENRFT
jgi:hypothetical protein